MEECFPTSVRLPIRYLFMECRDFSKHCLRACNTAWWYGFPCFLILIYCIKQDGRLLNVYSCSCSHGCVSSVRSTDVKAWKRWTNNFTGQYSPGRVAQIGQCRNYSKPPMLWEVFLKLHSFKKQAYKLRCTFRSLKIPWNVRKCM